jgi:alpha-glucosidase
LQFVNPDEFHQSFCFDLMLAPWRVDTLRSTIDPVYETLTAAGAPLTWTINNHDTQRSVTRYGRSDASELSSWTKNNLVYTGAPVDLELGTRRARAAIVLAAALPGSLYLFQGEELGLPEVLDLPDSVRQDPIWFRTEGREIGRDGCRVPVPWTTDALTSFGFSGTRDAGPGAPWLPQPDGWAAYAASAQAGDPSSVLALYRRLMAARRGAIDPEARLEWWDAIHPDVLAFRRGDVLVAVNVGEHVVSLAEALPGLTGGRLVIASAVDHDDPMHLPGNAACWVALEPHA